MKDTTLTTTEKTSRTSTRWKRFFGSLIPRIVIAIILGIILGLMLPEWAIGIFTTFNALFSSWLKFLIPLIIIGLVTPAIADIGKSAGRLLLITVAIAYSSTVLSGLFSFGISSSIFPNLITSSASAVSLDITTATVESYFTISIPPLADVMSALILSFLVGLSIAYMGLSNLKGIADETKNLVTKCINVAVIPLLPIYIFGIFLNITFTGQVWYVLKNFAAMIGVIFAMHIILLLIQYSIVGAITRRNSLHLLATMLPAYFTALGTSSSAATIPVTLRQTTKMGVSADVAGFTVPLCATIHMSGSCMKITSCAVALMIMQGMPFTTEMFVGFVLMLGVLMVASPGVPGGAIMASLAVLSSVLGFTEQDCGLMIALYIAMDSFGTACNVTGDGAIALIVNHIGK
ncbi:MAG: dicarboxylate/amino acid:cation symporter [Bacteroidaceae bacterium]|nr:dicarboxylate/amino acid:cation symporter [Bacteroidaceae bacterium]